MYKGRSYGNLKSSRRLLIPTIIVIGCIVGIFLVIDPVSSVNAKPINPGSSSMAVSDKESFPVLKFVNASVLSPRISQPDRRWLMHNAFWMTLI
jgi:hypothetical protein